MYSTEDPLILLICILLSCWLQVCSGQQAQQPDANMVSKLIGDIWTGSLSGQTHRITLYDEKGFCIFPAVNSNQPFSCMVTCGICHDVQRISGGWHFNAGIDPNATGRPGEPWIYWDCPTGTQIPLSYRKWPGTYMPEQVDIPRWWFARLFGRHMTGGGLAAVQGPEPDPRERWDLSGRLEINCLACHDAEPGHDQSQYGQQIAKHNFRWAAAATSAFATVEGAVQDLPDTWQQSDQGQLPQVLYDNSRFLADNKLILQITRQIPNQRCLFCHSVQLAASSSMERSVDVHLSAGMRCVDCHRNGLDHLISRGYVGDYNDVNNPIKQALTCEGCHLGKDSAALTGMAAPYPAHKGIPKVHLEKLSCTACHSGPIPKQLAVMAKTSRAHALGTPQANASARTLPHVFMPVFAIADDGKIYPHRLIWPAFWAQLVDNMVRPLNVDRVRQIAGQLLVHPLGLDSPDWPPFTRQQVQEVLVRLEEAGIEGPVYISGGRLYWLVDGQLVDHEHPSGSPYIWPLAHDVRPARSALGAVSCHDCHNLQAPLLFGKVPVDGPLADPNWYVPMVEFTRLPARYTGIFAWTFVFRPYLKLVVIAASGLVGLVLVAFLLRAVYIGCKAIWQLQVASTQEDREVG